MTSVYNMTKVPEQGLMLPDSNTAMTVDCSDYESPAGIA